MLVNSLVTQERRNDECVSVGFRVCRRTKVELNEMTTILERAEQRLEALPREEQAPRRELLGRVAEVVIEMPLEQLVPRVEEFADSDEAAADSWSLAEARKRNVERLLADQARLIKQAIRGSLVREGMNISRQRLHQLVAEGRLLAIQIQEGAPNLYPSGSLFQASRSNRSRAFHACSMPPGRPVWTTSNCTFSWLSQTIVSTDVRRSSC
jgi:hypothetical protein